MDDEYNSVEECKMFLYNNIEEQLLNRLAIIPTEKHGKYGGRPVKKSLLHRAIEGRRKHCALALISEDVRFRLINDTPLEESCLMV